jgi:hypothetical protein
VLVCSFFLLLWTAACFTRIDRLHLLASLSLLLVFIFVVSTSNFLFCSSMPCRSTYSLLGSQILINNINVVLGVIQPSRSFLAFLVNFYRLVYSFFDLGCRYPTERVPLYTCSGVRPGTRCAMARRHMSCGSGPRLPVLGGLWSNHVYDNSFPTLEQVKAPMPPRA